MATAREMLQTISAGYVPSFGHSLLGRRMFLHNRPIFTLRAVFEMLEDARVTFGIEMIKGPILANSQFKIDTDQAPPGIRNELHAFLVKNVTRFWRNSASRALSAIPWGRFGAEVLYKPEDGFIQFDILKEFQALDVRVITLDGKFVGINVRGRDKKSTYIGVPKAFWHIHWRHLHPWYGKSRLFAAYVPWIEKWSDGGYRDIRSLFWHKYAFDGGIIVHPTGSTINDDGEEIPNKDLARELIEKKKTGGTLTLPRSPDGTQLWEMLPANVPPVPTGLDAYGNSLDEEILEAMAIPPEVAKSIGTGAFAGRKIPMQAFQAILSEVVHWLMSDAVQLIFRPLVDMNFGKGIPFEVIPFGLLKKAGSSGQIGGAIGPDDPDEDAEMSHSLFSSHTNSIIAA